jgi:DNA ligase (NAD+)
MPRNEEALPMTKDVSGFLTIFKERYEEQRLEEGDLAEAGSLLKSASETYYNTGKRVMADEEFDWLREVWEYCTGEEMPVGAAPASLQGEINVPHEFAEFLGTLEKRNDGEGTLEWLKKKAEALGVETLRVGVSEKDDGNSFMAVFDEEGLCMAVTRGQDGKGVGVTSIFKGGLSAPQDAELGVTGRFAVQFEAMLTHSGLEAMCERIGKDMVSPRSAVTGIMGQSDDHEDAEIRRKYIVPVALGVRVQGKEITREQEIAYIQRHFNEGRADDQPQFVFAEYEGTPDEICEQILHELYFPVSEMRKDLDYMIDGLVIEVLGHEFRKELGWTYSGDMPKRPNYAMALKFPHMEKETIAKKLFMSMNGRRPTPMLEYEPVFFNGHEMRKTSLANWLRYDNLSLGIGTRVVVQYRNDVLCYVDKLSVPENDLIPAFKMKEFCPACRSDLRFTKNKAGQRVFAYCSSEVCPAVAAYKVTNWLSKLGAKGVKKSTIEKLQEAGLINGICDLYELDYNKVALVEGLGRKSADMIKATVSGTLTVKDYMMLGSLGIEGIGRSMCKDLLKHISLDDVLQGYETDSFLESVASIPNFGQARAALIQEGIRDNIGTIGYLMEALTVTRSGGMAEAAPTGGSA